MIKFWRIRSIFPAIPRITDARTAKCEERDDAFSLAFVLGYTVRLTLGRPSESLGSTQTLNRVPSQSDSILQGGWFSPEPSAGMPVRHGPAKYLSALM